MSALRTVLIAGGLAGLLAACETAPATQTASSSEPMVTYKREITYVNAPPLKNYRAVDHVTVSANATAPAQAQEPVSYASASVEYKKPTPVAAPVRKQVAQPAPAPAPSPAPVAQRMAPAETVAVPKVAKAIAVQQTAKVAHSQPARKPGKPVVYRKESLVNAPITRVRLKLGPPDHIQREGDVMLWTYREDGCSVHLLVDGERVKAVQVRKSLIHSASVNSAVPCFHRFVSERLSRDHNAASLR